MSNMIEIESDNAGAADMTNVQWISYISFCIFPEQVPQHNDH